MFYSQARGVPASAELVLVPLSAGTPNLWGSRDVTPPAPPAPAPKPLPPCPSEGCAGCGGCHWAYQNHTEPDPTRPFVADVANATALQCEAKCAGMVGEASSGSGCVGFTRKGMDCWFYQTVSGKFRHAAGMVSWHPNPK